MTQPLSFAALARDTVADTRALMPLALPVAAAFVLLPGVAIDLFGPPLPRTALAMTANTVVIELVAPALIALVAQLAILRLALDRRRGIARSVGEALAAAFRAWPFAVVALLLCAGPIALGMLALVVPGLYLAGRLTPAVALVVDGAGPVAAVEASWALTAGNGWRVIGFTALILGWFFILSAAGGAVGAGVVALLTAAGAGAAGAVFASTIDGAIAALFTIVNAAAVATIVRMLKA